MSNVDKSRPVVLLVNPEGSVVQADGVGPCGSFVWVPGVFGALSRLCSSGLFVLQAVWTSFDADLGGKVDPGRQEVARNIFDTLAGEGIVFDDDLPFDPDHAFVIGCKSGDVDLAQRCGCPLVWFGEGGPAAVEGTGVVLACNEPTWAGVASWLLGDSTVRRSRTAGIERATHETTISLKLNLDGTGTSSICSGLPFFDHMLQQIARHGRFNIELSASGDLEVDEHHTVEDVAIVLGQAVKAALGDKRGINRYGYEILTMDECRATVALDFSGRPWFVWDVVFQRDLVGSFPTELFSHFFKSFSDESGCNLHMAVTGGNTHHQAEALFKAFGRALRTAVFRYPWNHELPSTKGVL